MDKFCPPATASPKSPRGNTKAADSCAIGGEWGGGGGNQQNWQESTHPSPKLVFLFSSFIFESTGSVPRSSPQKKEADSKTAILILGKIRVNPIYLVIFFLVASPRPAPTVSPVGIFSKLEKFPASYLKPLGR